MKFKSTFLFFLIFLQSNLSLLGAHGFIRNEGQVINHKGQSNREVLFTLTQNGQSFHFSKAGWDFYTYRRLDSLNTLADKISCRFVGASTMAYLEEGEKQEYTEHYYQSYLKGGAKHAYSVNEFWIRGLYPGIDYHVILKDGKLKYEFEVAAGADISIIQWQYSGLELEEVLIEGHIQLDNSIGQMVEDEPICFKKETGQAIAGAFKRINENSWGYSLEDGNTTHYARVIDPWILWTSFYGGNGQDYQYGYRELKDGSIFISGMTYSVNNIALDGYRDTLLGQIDHYVIRLTKDGIPIWGSYYGGSGTERDGRMFFIGESQFFLLGTTGSNDSHSRSSHSLYNSLDQDILLYRVDSSGTPLWSKRFGGDSADFGFWAAISPDSLSLYIHGRTRSSVGEINTREAPRLSSSNYDGFLMKLDTAGNLQWSQVWGGDSELASKATNIEMGNNGDFVVIYSGSSRNKGTSNAFQPNPLNGTSPSHVISLYDSSGSVKWATYWGGNSGFSDGHVRMDQMGKIYVVGSTYSTSGFIHNAGPRQSTYGGLGDGYLAKMDTSGFVFWTRYLGGNQSDQGYILEFKDSSGIYVAGTAGTDPFFTGSMQNTASSSRDGFLLELDTAGVIKWGTYYGGDDFELPQYMSIRDHYITLSGYTDSRTYFGSHRSHQSTSSEYEGYLLRIAFKKTHSTFKPAPSYCSGDTLSIPIFLEDSLNMNNQIVVELSDLSGSFSNPLVLLMRSKINVGYDTLVVQLPVSAWTSSSYRLRFRLTSPQDTLTFEDSFEIRRIPNQNYLNTYKDILCPGDTVIMESVNPSNYNYVWMKDGQATGDTLKSIRVTAPGEYQAKITGTNGCVAFSGKRIFNMGLVPSARIFVEDSIACYNLQNFNAIDSSNETDGKRFWSLDGVHFDTAMIYNALQLDTGWHTLILIVQSPDACSDSIAQNFLVHPINKASFFVSDSFACLNEQNFLFQLPANHTYSMYQFTLGDTSSIFSLDSFGYSYVSSGTYPVKLKVENAFGCKDSTMKNIVVHAIPKANFNIVDTLFCSNLPATQFSNQSQNYLQSRWSFGDGDSSSYPNPSHAYTPGIYDVELVVRNAKGCRDTISKSLTMYAPPSVTIAYSDSMLCLGDSTLFQSNCDSSWNYFWSGSGMGCTQWVSDSSVHVLVVSDAQGCIDTATAKIGIFPPIQQPVITHSSDTLMANSGYAIYRWFYEGSLLPSASGSIFIASQNGKYKVEVEDANGCMAQSAEFILSGLGLTEKNNLSLLIYPNPNKGTFKIKLENSEITTQVSIAIFNGLGQKMPCTTNLISTNELEVKMNRVVPGIYYLKLVCKEKTYWKKVEVLPNSQ